MFRSTTSWCNKQDALYPTPSAPNIVKGFSKIGYRTLGVGGVHWFDTRFLSSSFWQGQYFEEFYWQENFGEEYNNSFENQISLVKQLFSNASPSQLTFFFINIAATHKPYRNGEQTIYGQAAALEYIDLYIINLI